MPDATYQQTRKEADAATYTAGTRVHLRSDLYAVEVVRSTDVFGPGTPWFASGRTTTFGLNARLRVVDQDGPLFAIVDDDNGDGAFWRVAHKFLWYAEHGISPGRHDG